MTRSRVSMLLLTCVFVLLLAPMAEVIGFEGFGANTSGGNTPVEVTSLADSGTGTLRAALSSGTNLRIVFRVGGTINLQSYLGLHGRSFITIDGSSAPGPGITLQGYGLEIEGSHDIIVTHLRIRNAVDDGILVWNNSYNVVIDHCSVTDSGDENIGITNNTHDVTVSWSIIGDSQSPSDADHTAGMLITNFEEAGPVTNVSLHHNLFVNEYQRSPQISTKGLFDLRNNVIWDWFSYATRIRNGAWGNIVNNVYASDTNRSAAVLLDAAGPVHINGNQGPAGINVNAKSTRSTPYAVAPVTTDPVSGVEQKVLQGVGACPRDATDTLLAGAGTCSSSNPSSEVLFLGADSTTKGNWRSIYGTEGYLLINYRGNGQDVVSLPTYLSTYTYSSTTQFFVWSSNTTDTRALAPISGSRAAATAYSGNTFSLTLTARDTTSHTLTLYFVDWDNRGRRQTITFYDATTNAILDQRTLSSFSGGVYYTYQVQGSVQVEMRRTGGSNAVLSGLFWD